MRCASPPESVPDGRSSGDSRGRSRRTSRTRWPRSASSGATDGASRPRSHAARSSICIAQASAMLIPRDLRTSGRLVEPGPAAVGAGGERHRPLDEGADMRLERVDVLGEHRLLDPRDEPLEGQVDPLDLDLGRLLVEQVVELLRRAIADRLVHVEAGASEDAAPPALHAVAGDLERAAARSDFVSRRRAAARSKSVIDPMPSQRGHMPPVDR